MTRPVVHTCTGRRGTGGLAVLLTLGALGGIAIVLVQILSGPVAWMLRQSWISTAVIATFCGTIIAVTRCALHDRAQSRIWNAEQYAAEFAPPPLAERVTAEVIDITPRPKSIEPELQDRIITLPSGQRVISAPWHAAGSVQPRKWHYDERAPDQFGWPQH